MAIAILDVDHRAPEIANTLLLNQCATRLLRTVQSCLALLADDPPDILLVVVEPEPGDILNVVRQAAALGIDVWATGKEDHQLADRIVSHGACGYLPQSLDSASLLTALGITLPTDDDPVTTAEDVAEKVFRTLLPSNASAMHHVYRQIKKAAPTRASMLITGESGTGKEMAAQAIHRLSPRAEHPFIAVNCGAITPQLIESELFGHERGSFTGAIREHRGYFERADGGTLFLDEITEMPLELQANLLRVLETQRFSRLGSTRELSSDIRLITACNRDPRQAVAEGFLREDLLYRIQVFPIHMPPLRQRDGDVELLIRHFLEAHNRSGGVVKRFSAEALAALVRYRWPGNVRELKNIVYRTYLMADTLIDLADLPAHISSPQAHACGHELTINDLTIRVGCTLAEMEETLITATLKHCRGNRERAAKTLGISTKTLYNRLRVYRQHQQEDELTKTGTHDHPRA